MNIDAILQLAKQQQASDVHFAANETPWFRVDGKLIKQHGAPYTKEQLSAALLNIMDEKSKQQFAAHFETDFAYHLQQQEDRFRANVYKKNNTIAAVFRLINSQIPTMTQIGIPEIMQNIAQKSCGLILITGPTGSGKSTTLASIIDYLNNNSNSHIITIEDPIEFKHQNKNCLISQREIGCDSKNFSAALRAALREDPDIILVGEMRDLETIRLALSAAETGHLVFATLHTMSAIKTIARIIDVFPGAEQNLVRTMLAEALQAVLAQVLLPKIGGGRVAAHELLLANNAIRNLIREDKLTQAYSVMQTSSAQGMQTLQQHLQRLIKQQIITTEDAFLYNQG